MAELTGNLLRDRYVARDRLVALENVSKQLKMYGITVEELAAYLDQSPVSTEDKIRAYRKSGRNKKQKRSVSPDVRRKGKAAGNRENLR